MKKFILITAVIFLITPIAISQNWMRSVGSTQNEEILDITHDNSGNILMGGYHSFDLTIGTEEHLSGGVSNGLIIKSNSSGTIIWSKNFGGFGADRIYSIATDASGNVYSTGYMSGTYQEGTVSVATNNNSRDIFISKHDQNGNLLWITTAGGANGDTGYGIDVDNNGNIFVTGQFIGDATFGGQSLTASYDSENDADTYDFFISKLDANGNFLWTKQGDAPYNDRGMSVAVDQSNNVYIGGQFSDTLTFDNTYNNHIVNAGFLLKIDNNGNELWFTKMAGLQSILYDVKVDNDNNPIVTGDYKGNMIVFGTTNQILTNSDYTYNTMVAKYSPSGEVLWLSDEGSENEVTSKQLTTDQHGNIFIAGLFKCRFSEFSEMHGTGIFNSMGYRDVFSVAYNSSGTRLWKEHYGSVKDDYCSAISIDPSTTNPPVLAGSFERYFNFSSTQNNLGPAVLTSPLSNNQCGTNTGQSVARKKGEGAKDIFFGSLYHPTNQLLDYFYRMQGSCVMDTIAPCLYQCQDTVSVFDNDSAYVTPFTYFPSEFGPILLYNWNNTGDWTEQKYYVDQTGTYPIEIKREDGCWENFHDTIHIIVEPTPEVPLITDNYGVNINQGQFGKVVKWCDPDSAYITCTNFSNSDTAFWQGDNFTLVNDSTILVDQTGNYEIRFINSIGCQKSNFVHTVEDTFAIHDTLQPHLIFYDSILNATDSIEICSGEKISFNLIDSLFFSVNQGETPYKWVYWSSIGGGSFDEDSTFEQHYNLIKFNSTGDYTIIAHLENPCGDTLDYFIERTIHVQVNERPEIIHSFTGPVNNCPGDTIMLYYSSNAEEATVTGPNILAHYDDSVMVLVTNNEAEYELESTLTDSNTLCQSTSKIEFEIELRPVPQVTISPSHGIICPDDSLEMTALDGVSWEWIGPTNNGFSTEQTAYGQIPGYYHAIVTDADGCVMTSNFVEAKEYSTPFIFAEPQLICEGGETTVYVVGDENTNAQWQAPLSGGAFEVTVNQEGTYYCEMELCGITTIDSVEILVSTPAANITSNVPLELCPNDTVPLFANGGMIQYEWSSGESDNAIYATETGDYWVIVTNEYGCIDTSDVLTISALPSPTPPTASDTIICSGSTVQLIANSNLDVHWFANPSDTSFYTGDTLNIEINEVTTFYLATEDSICSSEWTELEIGIHEGSIVPDILGDTIYCVGDSIVLSSNSLSNLVWNTPSNDSLSGANLLIEDITAGNSGIYSLYAYDSLCSSDTNFISVTINEIPSNQLSFNGDSTICFGSNISLEIENLDPNTQISWNNSSSTNPLVIDEEGTYYAILNNNGCIGSTNLVNIFINDELAVPEVNDTMICPGNDAYLFTEGQEQVTWYNSNNVEIGFGENITLTNVTEQQTISYILTDILGCSSIPGYTEVFIAPTENAPEILINGTGCLGTYLTLSTNEIQGVNYEWTLPDNSTSSNSEIIINPMTEEDAGTYSLMFNANGCLSDTSFYNLEFYTVDSIDLPTDTTICYGDAFNLYFDDSLNYHWSDGTSESYLEIYNEGLTTVGVSNQYGCAYTDSILVTVVDCDSLNSPNVFTPNNDGVNDVFYFGIIETQHQKVIVRNRYGNIVHIQESDDQVNWDGNDYLQNLPVTNGVYLYTFIYTDWEGNKHEKNGFVTVKR